MSPYWISVLECVVPGTNTPKSKRVNDDRQPSLSRVIPHAGSVAIVVNDLGSYRDWILGPSLS